MWQYFSGADAIWVRPLDNDMRAYDAVSTVEWNLYPGFPNRINLGVTIGKRNAPFWQMFQVTTHLLSIERADWPNLHDMFKARDANVWQREFPVGFPVEVSALNSLFIYIFHDVVTRIESKCVIKAKHVLLVC